MNIPPETTRMLLRDLRSLLNKMLDNNNVESVLVAHAPGGISGCCTFKSEWTFTLYRSESIVDTVRWSEGEYSSETGWINEDQ